MKVSYVVLLFLFVSCCKCSQVDNLLKLIRSQRSLENRLYGAKLDQVRNITDFSPVWIGSQRGLREADKIDTLPGQPAGVDFDQYAGYVTVDPKAGRSLFYYFVESPQKSSTKPLVIWLNGGPGCSSLGYGAMEEIGPFRVNANRKTLFRNDHAWNKVANVLFLESPAGVGFSYSNTTTENESSSDDNTAIDSYAFLLNWLERFPHYKTRNLFITGESYAGHYIPQLADLILSKNKVTNQTIINLKGIAVGNAWLDISTGTEGMYDYLWTHAVISDEANDRIHKECDFVTGNFSSECSGSQAAADNEVGNIDLYSLYAPVCNTSNTKATASNSVYKFDPCSDSYVESYLNIPEVQRALHVKPTKWVSCSNLAWLDSPQNVIPVIKKLLSTGIRIWLYSGDADSICSITTTKYALNTLKLPVEKAWRPWQSNNEVGGYVVGYRGLTLVTIRAAGHMVPSYQPERALTMISYFLGGGLLPQSSNSSTTKVTN